VAQHEQLGQLALDMEVALLGQRHDGLVERRTVLDWVGALSIPAVVVTGSYLGTLSHTLTALDVLRARDIAVTALVVNETPDSTVPLAETVQTLARFAPDIRILEMPRGSGDPSQHPAIKTLAALL
jgi:dethiobiotin synthetase